MIQYCRQLMPHNCHYHDQLKSCPYLGFPRTAGVRTHGHGGRLVDAVEDHFVLPHLQGAVVPRPDLHVVERVRIHALEIHYFVSAVKWMIVKRIS